MGAESGLTKFIFSSTIEVEKMNEALGWER